MLVNQGEQRQASLPDERADLAPRHVAVAGHVVDAGHVVGGRVHRSRRDDVILVHELDARIEAEDLGDDRSAERERERRVEVVAEHVGEAQQRDAHVRAVVGKVTQERLDLEQRAFDVGGGSGRARRCPRGRSTDPSSRRRRPGRTLFSTTLRTGLPDAPAAASRFIVPMTLISCRARDAARVESTMRCVCRIVSTCVAAHDAGEDRVRSSRCARTRCVRAGSRGSRVSTPDDDLDVGPALERLRRRDRPSRCSAR